MLRVLTLLGLVLSVFSASAPFIKPCNPTDQGCLASSAKTAIPYFAQGVPELGIKPMDPLQLPLIESDHNGLKLVFKDSTLTGLKNCALENLKNDPANLKQSVSLKCNLILKGDYVLDGQLIILPVKGEGKYSIDLRDIVIKTGLDLEIVTGNDGQKHWHIKKPHHTFKVLTGTTFDFKNLFNGNDVLAKPVIEFANNNWKDVMQELAPPVVKAIVLEVVKAVEALYSSVPFPELVA